MESREQTVGSISYRPISYESCSICFNPLRVDDWCATHLPCGKCWHEDCFLAWIIRGEIGSCPNCRRKICARLDRVWLANYDRAENIIQASGGVWVHGKSGHIRSKNSELPGSLRPPKIDRRLARRLASDCTIYILPQLCRRCVIPRYRHDRLSCQLSPFNHLHQSQYEWLQERARLAAADAVVQVAMNEDFGWRLLSYHQDRARIRCLVHVKVERRQDEEMAWEAYKKWESMPLCDRLLARPCPMWTLEQYDEAYIIGYDDLYTILKAMLDQECRETLTIAEKNAQADLRRSRKIRISFSLGDCDEDDVLALLRVFEGEITRWELPAYNDTYCF